MKNLKIFTILLVVGLALNTTALAADITSAQSGDWNTAATWDPPQIPIAGDNVTILSSHTITLAAVGACQNLTMGAGATLSLNAASLTVPGNNWYLDPASTVIYNGPTTVQTGPTYGNLTYSSANGGPGQNTTLTISGNLTVTTATLRGIATTSGANTINVTGNVIIGTGTSARISGVNNSSATSASCTWNIGGNVTLNGGVNTNRFILFESAGPHSGNATFNIDGDINIGSGAVSNPMIQLRSSTTVNTSNCTGTINVKGNITNSGDIRTSTGATGTSLIINMNGTSPQQYTGNSPMAHPTGQTCNLQINNSAGVTLNNAVTVNGNVALTLANGILNTTATNLLTIGAGSLSGGSASSFVNGQLQCRWRQRKS